MCVSGDAKQCPPEDDCHTLGECDPATGKCVPKAKPDGTHCDDHDPWTYGICQQGVCKPNPIPGWTRTLDTKEEQSFHVNKMALDESEGVLYILGSAKGKVDFDPSEGKNEHEFKKWGYFVSRFTVEGEYIDTPIIIESTNGCAEWGDYVELSIAVDDSSVYIGGPFRGIVDFDATEGEVIRVSSHESTVSCVFSCIITGSFCYISKQAHTQNILHPLSG